MSKVKVQPPAVVHLPSFKKWGMQRYYIARAIEKLNLEFLYPEGVHAWYFYTNGEGWAEVLSNLVFSSNLYKQDIFTCINYAFKAWNECSSRYGLNTLFPVIGHIPAETEARHAFNLLLIGNETGIEDFLIWEPNDGFECSGLAFEIGENGYTPELILI